MVLIKHGKAYQPQKRIVRARILTDGGWVSGNFNLPQTAFFLDFLNRGSVFETLTDVSLPDSPQEIPFFLLNRASIVLLIVSEEREITARPSMNLISRRVRCLFRQGSLEGDVDILQGARISDHFGNRRGFVVMSGCRLLMHDVHGDLLETEHRRLVVNTDTMIGLSDAPASVQATPS